MKTQHFQIQFHTPAFLGDANQSGRWRTPPFKAQLRQWWRVAYAAQLQFAVNVHEMREVEGRLFGHAWLENDKDEQGQKVAARRSEVRIRLSRWDEGQLKSWQTTNKVNHPEVGMVDSSLYMGYGPVLLPRGSREPTLKANAAIQANEHAQLNIAFPDAQAALLDQALQLMHLYGTVGGRSRNGWGSYSLTLLDGEPMALSATSTRALAQCLSADWPHALGADSHGPLIWQTQAHSDWAGLMRTLAEIKIALRTQAGFKFPHAQPDGQVHDRHWLSYPITRHDVNDWKRKNLRLPNQLRFKVRPLADGKLVGLIFHMAHKPPVDFDPRPAELMRIWDQVHQHLDSYIKPAPESAHLKLTRIKA
jgi:CRISPR-associated protein Cmr1